MEAIRNEYAKLGIDNFYKMNANSYTNPHINIIKKLLSEIQIKGNCLDLCCGGGEVTNNINVDNIIGCDPYTFDLYTKNTSKKCLKYDFKDIANGKITDNFNYIICSFALHLCPASLLDTVLFNLALISENLIIVTPNKKPEIKNYWTLEKEIIKDRVRLRIYKRNIEI